MEFAASWKASFDAQAIPERLRTVQGKVVEMVMGAPLPPASAEGAAAIVP